MPEAVPELIWFALLLFCFALVYVVRRFINALFAPIISVVGSIPALGGALGGALSSVEQSISNALGSVEHGIDALMGASWHRTAQLTDWLWRELEGHASLLAQIASFIPGLGNVVAALRALVHHSVSVNSGATARLKTLEKEFHGIEHQVKQLERDVSKGIGSDVLPRLRSLDHEVARIEHSAIPAIQAADSQAASAISNLYDWIRGKADIIGAGTLIGAVTAAIAVVGNGWLGCKENPFSKSNNPCGLWSDFARFLPFLGLLALSFDFPEFVKAADTVAEFIGPAVSGIEGTFITSLDPLPPPN